jgi:hypothetical protein
MYQERSYFLMKLNLIFSSWCDSTEIYCKSSWYLLCDFFGEEVNYTDKISEIFAVFFLKRDYLNTAFPDNYRTLAFYKQKTSRGT